MSKVAYEIIMLHQTLIIFVYLELKNTLDTPPLRCLHEIVPVVNPKGKSWKIYQGTVECITGLGLVYVALYHGIAVTPNLTLFLVNVT